MKLPPVVIHLPLPQDDALALPDAPPREPFEAAGFQVRALRWDNRKVRRTRIPFTWPCRQTPRLQEFVNRYDFLEFIEKGSSEWERVLLLREWVHRNIPCGAPVADPWEPFEILDTAASGARYICTQFMVVLQACAVAAGWPSRWAQVDSAHTKKERSTAHGVVDVWVNELGKWVALDAMYNVHYEEDGLPLSPWEIGQRWAAKRGGDVDVCVGLARKKVKSSHKAILHGRHESSAYFWCKHTWAWDPFSSFGKGPVDCSLALIGKAHRGKVWYQGAPPKNYLLNAWQRGALQFTRREADAYPDMNTCRLALAPSEERRAVKVKVDTCTPGFDTLLVKVDEGTYRRAALSFTWYLHPGENALSVRARNEFGILGRPSVVHATLASPSSVGPGRGGPVFPEGHRVRS